MTKVTIERGIAFFEDGTEVSDVSVALIKAAPKLLKALEYLCRWKDRCHHDDIAYDDGWSAALAAISEAKGGLTGADQH